jgi:YidC/Oxa1 family membrane protein insertase
MTAIRRAFGRAAGLAPIDLLTAAVIALIAFSLIAAPVVAQDQSPLPSPVASPQAPAGSPPAQPLPTVEASPVPGGTPGASPAEAAPAATSVPGQGTPSPSPGPPCPPPDPQPTPQVAPGATPAPTPLHNLCPAQPGADPISLLAWIFTPIFQVLFMGLALLYDITGDIGIAIILLTILIRLLLVPVFRAQIVSQRRMQILQPELRAISVKYKGNRAKISEEQMKLYRERGVNPAAGCFPALLQLVLLLPMYQVFTQGLSSKDISSMLQVFGTPVITVQCQDPSNPYVPCIDPDVAWLAWMPRVDAGLTIPGYVGGLPANQPEVFWNLLPGLFGLSLLAFVSAALQLVQTRMMTTQTDDPQARTQQRIFLLLPLFSILYGAVLPAGLFIYWITTTIFSIVQQYLINGWGGLFPLFGWTPRFAANHTPRYPVPAHTPRAPVESAVAGTAKAVDATRRSTKESAAGTIRPARGRTSRRGRRR